MTTDKNMSKR